jgi:HK97 gp10 family phage protein
VNIQQFVAAVRAAQAEMDARNRKLVTKIVVRAEANTKRHGVTPRKTSTLARSITHRVVSSTEGRVGTNVNYAKWVHDGTRRMAARPFFVWGITRTMQEVEPLLKEHGVSVVDDIARGA